MITANHQRGSKMVKSVKIGIMNTQVTQVTPELSAGSKCATNNAGPMTTNFPSVALKILAGLCIGEMVMIAATAGTLGFFVNRNLKRIEDLQKTSETSHYTSTESASKMTVKDLDARLNKYDGYDERISELETSIGNAIDRLDDIDTIIASDSATIKEHKEAIANVSENLSLIVPDIALYNRVTNLEQKRESDFSNFQILNDTVSALVEQNEQNAEVTTCGTTCIAQNHSETIIVNGTTDRELIQKFNSTLVDLGNRLSQVAADKANISDRITELEIIGPPDTSVLKIHNETLFNLGDQVNKLVSDWSAIENYTDRITELEENQSKQNETLINHEKRIVELETDLSLVQNTINILMNTSEFDIGNLTVASNATSTLLNQEKRIAGLEIDVATLQNTNSNLTDHENRIGDLETVISLVQNTTDVQNDLQRSFDDISDRQAVLDAYCSLATNNSVKIDKLLLDAQTNYITIWQHESTLQDMLNRLSIIEGSFGEEPSYAFYATGVGHVRVYTGDVLVFPTVQLDEAGLYDTTTGKYRTTSEGLYIFYATLCVDWDQEITVDFMAGADSIGMLKTGTGSWSNCASSTAMARLQQGEDVYLQVKNTVYAPYILNDVYRLCTFSGHRIGA